jgi:hypothetical protein
LLAQRFGASVLKLVELDGVLIEKKFVNFIPRTREELTKYYSHYVKQVEYEALFLTANGREVRKAFLLFVKRAREAKERAGLWHST